MDEKIVKLKFVSVIFGYKVHGFRGSNTDGSFKKDDIIECSPSVANQLLTPSKEKLIPEEKDKNGKVKKAAKLIPHPDRPLFWELIPEAETKSKEGEK